MIIYLGRRLLAASSSIPGAGRVAPVRLLCLAPGGGCLAADITAGAGGLLHHRFTLAALADGNIPLCCPIPSGRPARLLAGTAPCGGRTFLDAAAPRSPDLLGHTIIIADVTCASEG